MYRKQTTRKALGLLMALTISAAADQQEIYPPSAMPRVDMHTHMDAKTQYAKAIDDMDQWGGTISISLAGLFWVKDNNGSNASPASVRQIPGSDMVYVKEKLDDRILFVPGAFTIPREGIWWTVDEIKTFNMNGTWKLPGDKLAGLPAGTYDVKVTAKNSIGLVRTDSTTNELTVAGSSGKLKPTK